MSQHLLILETECPACRALLTEGEAVHLDAHVDDPNQDGAIFLSAVFGDQTITTDLAIPEGTMVEFRCPHCDASLMLRHLCPLCGAAMASINISSGGYLEFCSRRGCRGHALGGFGDIDQMMTLVNRMLKTPHD
jgi:hypothetical protein